MIYTNGKEEGNKLSKIYKFLKIYNDKIVANFAIVRYSPSALMREFFNMKRI